MKKFRTIVIDDEQEARDGICRLLTAYRQFEVIGTCDNGLDAINRINELQPDLIFLDIQMPQINGFEVLNSLEADQLPKIVFVTAYDQYALQAFEVHAVDYLLKPFSDSRFEQTVHHVLALLKEKKEDLTRLKSVIDEYLQHGQASRDEELIPDKSEDTKVPHQLIIKSSGKILFIPLNEIIHISAENYHVQVHTEKCSYRARESLKSLEDYLRQASFIRIHKSSLVNSQFIREVEPYFNGELILKLTTGEQLKVSRHYRKNLPKIFG